MHSKLKSIKKRLVISITIISLFGFSFFGGITLINVSCDYRTVEKPSSNNKSDNKPTPIKNNSAEGFLSNDNPEDYYYYKAKESGLYSFTLQDMDANAEATVQVLDTDKNKINDDSSGTNSIYTTLEENTRYLIKVDRIADDTSYTLSISPPSQMKDISGEHSISGSTKNEEQSIVYAYRPTVSGIHYFEVGDRTLDYDIYIEIFGKNNSPVENGSGYNSLNVELQAGVYYRIELTGGSELTAYTFNIGSPNPVVDLSSITSYSDKISYIGQENYYTFTAPRSGTYRLDLDNRTADESLYIEFFGKNDSPIDDGSGSNGVTVSLDSGSKYKIKITSSSSVDEIRYDLNIGIPDSIKTVTRKISGTIRYTDQKNTYVFTPSQTARYSVTAENRTRDEYVFIKIFTSNENILGSGSNVAETDDVLKKGKDYYVNVEYSSGDTFPIRYTLLVDKVIDE